MGCRYDRNMGKSKETQDILCPENLVKSHLLIF